MESFPREDSDKSVDVDLLYELMSDGPENQMLSGRGHTGLMTLDLGSGQLNEPLLGTGAA